MTGGSCQRPLPTHSPAAAFPFTMYQSTAKPTIDDLRRYKTKDANIRKKKSTGATCGSNTHKVAPDAEGKFNGFKSGQGKLLVIWDPHISCLATFKASAIKIITSKDAKELGLQAQELEDLVLITWAAVIPHGGKFAVNQKATPDNSDQFEKFLGKWGGSSETQ
ncbi:hypothetical protein VP01_347g7 [Puccinia sorghi]|uniref:Uncharacterized protein n=1 Tax=Puccinia sorghi TaxID=27349 RepID=A0A0L6UWS3_9BASI|nr:hypothetical protein VP01_347g7 [Puccinia sorghi]